jgi:hypothetical protein
LGGISRIRWLTHTGRQVPPSGLKPNSRISTGDPLPKILTRGLPPHPPAPLSPSQSPGGQGGQAVFIKRRDFGEINGTLRQRLQARRTIGTRAYRSQAAIWSLGCFLCVLCAFAVIARIRWLTHTGRQVSPSGLKPNSRISTGDPLPKILTRGLPPHPPAPLSPSQSPGGQGGPSGFYQAS